MGDVARQREAWEDKVDSGLCHAFHDHRENPGEFSRTHASLHPVLKAGWGPNASKVAVIVEYNGNENEENLDGDITINGGNSRYRTAYLPIESLPRLAQHEAVARVHPSRLNKLYNDQASKIVNVNQTTRARTAGGENIGQGVVVGIIDTGVDYTHPMFKDRVVYVWDQNVQSSVGWKAHKYGRVYTVKPGANEYPLSGYQGDGGPVPHGTHVAGTAAGRHKVYSGIAPGATIVVVACNFMDSGIIDGTDFVWWVADKLGLPAVINLSLGSQSGPHDGTDALDQALSQRISPGRLICAAAGNEGSDAIHTSATLSADHFTQVKFSSLGPIGLNVWLNSKAAFQFRFRSGRAFSDTFDSETSPPSSKRFRVGNLYIQFTINGNSRGSATAQDLFIDATSFENSNYILELKLSSNNISTNFHAWLLTGEQSTGSFDSTIAQYSYLIGPPGSSRDVITVAALNSRLSWIAQNGNVNIPGVVGTRADFSSPGPLVGSHPEKPDVAAPGAWLISALSSQADPQDPTYLPRGTNDLLLMQGTSMATPVVTGLVAMLLHDKTDLSAQEAKDALVHGNNVKWNALVGRGTAHTIDLSH